MNQKLTELQAFCWCTHQHLPAYHGETDRGTHRHLQICTCAKARHGIGWSGCCCTHGSWRTYRGLRAAALADVPAQAACVPSERTSTVPLQVLRKKLAPACNHVCPPWVRLRCEIILTWLLVAGSSLANVPQDTAKATARPIFVKKEDRIDSTRSSVAWRLPPIVLTGQCAYSRLAKTWTAQENRNKTTVLCRFGSVARASSAKTIRRAGSTMAQRVVSECCKELHVKVWPLKASDRNFLTKNTPHGPSLLAECIELLRSYTRMQALPVVTITMHGAQSTFLVEFAPQQAR